MRNNMNATEKPVNWNNVALKMILVLILILAGIMHLFNQNSDAVYTAYYNITDQTNPYAAPDSGEPGAIFLPHHILLIMIAVGIIVVIAFAVYILGCIDEDENYHSNAY
ncbi:MAG: hypothetical protein U9Q92_06830 [archaeon]|nr:hypothetical protein [archaeon]